MRGRQSGFTILELMVFLTLIGVVACVAIPMYFARPEVTLDSAAQQLARDLRRAQNRAAYLSTATAVVFDAGGDGYWIVEGDGGAWGDVPPRTHFERRYSRDGVFEGVRITKVVSGPEGEPRRAVRFGPRGDALGPARVTLSFDDEKRVARVDARSGLVTIEGAPETWVDTGR